MTAEAATSEADASLEAKVRFLSAPSAYAGLGEPVATRETHMSWVFLAGDRAYKLKKAIRLPYLDFSTLPLREAACRAELRLNRRLAPDVYLGVVPLVAGPRGPSIGGEGEVLDWLVEMRRLDEASVLDTRLRNHVTDRELDSVARTLVRFYRHARPVHIAPSVHLAEWRKALAFNRRILLDPRFDLPRGLIRRIDASLRRFLDLERERLADRALHGRVVDAHGDLRPEHIWMGRPVRIIDCLEFSSRLRANDPMDEIAFLDLECERLGEPDAGRRIRRKVLAALNERSPEPLYSFYRCHRAMLRARLAIAHLLDPRPRTPEKWPRLALVYLDLAARDSIAMERRLQKTMRSVSGR